MQLEGFAGKQNKKTRTNGYILSVLSKQVVKIIYL